MQKFHAKFYTGLRNVEYLEMPHLSQKSKTFLYQLDLSSRFLSSLGKLHISCGLWEVQDPGYLGIFQSSKNLLKSLSHLDLYTVCQSSHYKGFQSLANCCPKLLSLSFKFSYEKRQGQYIPTEINYLGVLETFQSLKFLRIEFNDIFTLLRDFALPASVQELQMNLKECFSKSLMQQIEPRFNQIEENERRNRFHENFRSIKNLRRLVIFFHSSSDKKAFKYQNYFSRNLLKRPPSLKSLCLFYDQDIGEKHDPSLKMSKPTFQESNLAKFLESCESFSQTLEKLVIGAGKIWFSNFDLSMFRNKFPKLKSIDVSRNFNEDQNSKDCMGSFLNQLFSLGNSITLVRIGTFITQKTDSLLSLLSQIPKVEVPKKAKVALQIHFLHPGIFPGTQITESSVKDGISRLQGFSKVRKVSAWIVFCIGDSEMKRFLEQYAKKFDNCEIRASDSPYGP